MLWIEKEKKNNCKALPLENYLILKLSHVTTRIPWVGGSLKSAGIYSDTWNCTWHLKLQIYDSKVSCLASLSLYQCLKNVCTHCWFCMNRRSQIQLWLVIELPRQVTCLWFCICLQASCLVIMNIIQNMSHCFMDGLKGKNFAPLLYWKCIIDREPTQQKGCPKWVPVTQPEEKGRN